MKPRRTAQAALGAAEKESEQLAGSLMVARKTLSYLPPNGR